MADQPPSANTPAPASAVAPTAAPTGSVQAKFVTGSPLRHVVVMASTGAVGLVAIFLVDVANLFYISLLGQQELAAAVGYAATIMFFAVSACIGFTIAGTAITARAIGSADRDRARVAAGSSLIAMVAMTLLMSLILFAGIDTWLDLLGASGETKAIAAWFMAITIPSIPLLGIGMMCAGLLRAQGDAKRAMYVTLSSGLAAMVIDPLLIFGLDLGITGAAISVVIVRCLFVLVGFHGTIRVHDMIALPRMPQFMAFLSPFMKIGLPAVLTQVATPVGNAYVTGAVAQFGDDAVAGWAIVGRIIPLAFAAVFSLSGAVGPILSQNYGAGRLDRVNATMRAAFGFTVVYVFGVWALLIMLRGPIEAAFSAQGDAKQMIEIFCLYVAGTQIFTGFLFVSNAAFNNLDHPVYSTVFNWGRATLGVIPFVYFGSRYGPEGIMLAWGFGGLLFGVLALFATIIVLRRLPGQARAEGIEVYVPPVANSPFSSGRGAGL